MPTISAGWRNQIIPWPPMVSTYMCSSSRWMTVPAVHIFIFIFFVGRQHSKHDCEVSKVPVCSLHQTELCGLFSVWISLRAEVLSHLILRFLSIVLETFIVLKNVFINGCETVRAVCGSTIFLRGGHKDGLGRRSREYGAWCCPIMCQFGVQCCRCRYQW